jgi:sugar O-acyltransferase (sialic acid O-acetyltransferase NeuD family)
MVFLIGASGHSKVILEILELQNKVIGGISDKNQEIKELLGYSVNVTFPEKFNYEFDEVIVCVGDNIIRKRIVLENNFIYGFAIHPNTNISKSAKILNGSVIMGGVSINVSTQIGFHCILNTNASIDHDCFLEDFVHISPNAALAGNVFIGEGTHVGIGASIIQGVKIGKWVTIGAGTVILNDVPDYAVIVGNPGKIIRYNSKENE